MGEGVALKKGWRTRVISAPKREVGKEIERGMGLELLLLGEGQVSQLVWLELACVIRKEIRHVRSCPFYRELAARVTFLCRVRVICTAEARLPGFRSPRRDTHRPSGLGKVSRIFRTLFFSPENGMSW